MGTLYNNILDAIPLVGSGLMSYGIQRRRYIQCNSTSGVWTYGYFMIVEYCIWNFCMERIFRCINVSLVKTSNLVLKINQLVPVRNEVGLHVEEWI